MAKRKGGNALGSWAFLIGVVLALVFGALGNISSNVTLALVALGIIIGILNISEKETHAFLMSGTVLVIVSTLGQGVVSLVPLFETILRALTILFVPATIIVALRHVFSMAKN